MRTSALLEQKTSNFLEIYGVSARARGVNFSKFYADVFYERPLLLGDNRPLHKTINLQFASNRIIYCDSKLSIARFKGIYETIHVQK